MRGTVQARLGNARLHIQIDVGIGDAVVPSPEWLEYPSLLGFPPPRLRVYRPETAIAEKLHAMVELGKDNSRMRDFFDIYALAAQRDFSGDTLVAAVRATFERRRTPLPETLPLALTPEFATLGSKLTQWRGFLTRSGVSSAPREFDQVITMIARFLEPVIGAARAGTGRAADDADRARGEARSPGGRPGATAAFALTRRADGRAPGGGRRSGGRPASPARGEACREICGEAARSSADTPCPRRAHDRRRAGPRHANGSSQPDQRDGAERLFVVGHRGRP